MDLDQQLCFKLYAGVRAVTKLYRPLLDELELTYPQYLVMLVLWEAGRRGKQSATVKYVGERLYLDSGTLTPLLKRLESRGLLSRMRSRDDEREVHVSLTAVGRALEARAEVVPRHLLCAASLPLSELVALRESLDRLLQALPAEEKQRRS
ncbi:MarR family transcriptional regulator [Alkalilimnicola ehrlichii]|uniref:MarR family transcriptional regulator n=1 Tax=Alkalilimnicola ehrlichii TaxID=351052 RepID=A0A3E0WMF3_9GAMM|nr:MarR family transcriptional regulator [Alkalilimnicola ehrlichii]RFA33125.1 MarR family transcriptional regulator [Alkalilimnicola ehrlichii]